MYSRLREALTRHDPTPGHVTIAVLFEPAACLVPIAPDRIVVIIEDSAVVLGPRLVVVVGGVHAVRFVCRGLYLGGVEGPGLAFHVVRCVG